MLRPFSITFSTLIFVAAWAWVDTSNTEYHPGQFAGGRTTAGWFVLGLPFLMGFALLASMPFSFVGRRTRPVVGWLLLLSLFAPLIVFAWTNTTPVARLRAALDIEPPMETRIQWIAQYDSFNDGITIVGVCTADRSFVDQLISKHDLSPSDSAGILKQMLPDEPIPENASFLAGDGLSLFYDVQRSLMYFCRQVGQRNPTAINGG